MMKIGNTAPVIENFDEMLKRYIRLSELGYDAVDVQFADTTKEWYKSEEKMAEQCAKVRECAERSGLILNQVHGPWPTDDKSPASREEVLKFMKLSVYAAGQIGAPYMIIHPQMPFGWGEEHDNGQFAFDLTVKLLRDLIPDCEKYNVTVCLENMPMRKHVNSAMENIVKIVKTVNSPYIQICMDTGHTNYLGHDLGDDARCAGSLIKTLHVHDNDGTGDQHRLPYLGTANWDSFVKALAEIGYDGVMSMETNNPAVKSMPKEVYVLAEKITVETAKNLASQVDAYRK